MTKIKSECIAVESSFVSSLWYNYTSRKLIVIYKSGSLYEYSDVKLKTFKKIKKAKSIGVALHKEIFKIYSFTKIK